MVNVDQTAHLLDNGVVVGQDGERLGKVSEVYLDDQTGVPSWVTVKTGWFGAKESFVPLDRAQVDGDDIRVPYDKETVRSAPHFEAGEPLSPDNEEQLYSYYGLGTAGTTTDTSVEAPGTTTRTADADRDLAVAGTADRTGGDDVLTRSEEHLNVGTQRVETGRARLRKYVVTENQTVTVPVQREEVRVEREPIGPEAATGGAEIGEATAEVTLSEERVVVHKETVPVEQVRLTTDTVTEQQQVTEAVRKEEIEVDTDPTTDRTAR
ncbi:DUF2382 domain-containing protein [Nakamurella leprariae]|uniref:PRC and DUF2382 domain-containing protein n=1 Tax=Nakamurella leprariae TaxID=2803911 RepID=A0A938YEE9_9ACTN|nr:PRC and DUF2382 domain-containing protein [Nakamurella leprariae]MBM9468036.1 PRC and DUF2382 domain-containing protein [Nakamurella leprariae]